MWNSSRKVLKEEPLAAGPGSAAELRTLFPQGADVPVVRAKRFASELPSETTRCTVKDAIVHVILHQSWRPSADRAGSRFEQWYIMGAMEDGLSEALAVL